MRWHTRKKLLLLLTFLFVSIFLISSVEASPYYITHPTYFPSKSGSYITFDTSLLPINFNTLYRDTQTRWHFNDYWLTTTKDVSITAWFTNDWLNYTTSEAGTQEIYTSKPNAIYFDEQRQVEGSAWSYDDSIVTVTTSGTNVALYWGQVEEPPPPPPPSIFATQALEDYNTNLMNRGMPYITGSTNTITALTYGSDKLRFTVTGGSGTSGTVTVYCQGKGSPVKVVGAMESYSEASKTSTLTVNFGSDVEVLLDWNVPAGETEPKPTEPWTPPTIIPTPKDIVVPWRSLRTVLVVGVLGVALVWLLTRRRR